MRTNFYLLSVLMAAATAASASYDPDSVAWSRLEFQATKFFLTARSEVELGTRSPAEARSELLDPTALAPLRRDGVASRAGDARGMGLAPRGARAGVLDIRTRILSRDSRVRFWFDPGDARALQRSSHDTSKNKLRHRTYRYTRGGVFSRTLRPGDGEDERAHTGWSLIDDNFVGLARAAGGPAVTEAAGLLYLVPAGDLHAPGDRDRLRVYTRGQVREVDVAVTGRERIAVDYLEVSDRGERAVDGKVETLRIAVRPRVGEGEDSRDFKLLGLQGDIDIYLEPRTRVPLLVSGKIEIAGSVRLRLRRAVLR